MELMDKLREIEKGIQPLKERIYAHLNTIDWNDEILIKMVNDDEYTPVIPTLKETGLGELYTAVMNELTRQPNPELRDYFWKIHEELRTLYQSQVEYLKREYLKLDVELRPSLLCIECGYFGSCEKTVSSHKCKKRTICIHCGVDCKTYERFQKHIEKKLCMQSHVCDVCNYKTNSNNEWLRHSKSKDHKERAGIQKQVYKCIPCDYMTEFQSKYKEHCNNKKHRKLCAL